MSKTRLFQQGRRITASVRMDVCQQARLPERPVHRALPLMVAPGLVCSVSTARSNPDVQPAVASAASETRRLLHVARRTPWLQELKLDDCILLRNLKK